MIKFASPFAAAVLDLAKDGHPQLMALADRTDAAVNSVACAVDTKADAGTVQRMADAHDVTADELYRVKRLAQVGGATGFAQGQVSCIEQTLANETQALQAAALNIGTGITAVQLQALFAQQGTAITKAASSKAAVLKNAADWAAWQSCEDRPSRRGFNVANSNVSSANGGATGASCGC